MEKNTENIVRRAYAKLWMLRRLKRMGADSKILKLVYYRHIRSILEFGVPVWNGALTVNESKQIERVQKIAIHIIYGRSLSYRKSLEKFNIERLKIRRRRLCLNFAKKALKHERFKGWFLSEKKSVQGRVKFAKTIANCKRLKNAPIPYLTALLNKNNEGYM